MFTKIKEKVQAQFNKMAKSELFVVEMEKNELFDAYLAALPEAERQEHNCNCCKSFLNHYGNIVTIEGGEIHTIWDFQLKVDPYKDVPGALRELVLSKAIEKPFLSTFEKLGTDFNRQQLENGEVIRWEHFFVTLPRNKVLRSSKSIESHIGDLMATKGVFERSLQTITIEASETVLELIAENSLYRGKEFEASVVKFLKHQQEYNKLKKKSAKSLFVWLNYKEGGRIRNTAIGTLLVNLSEGMPLEQAVRAFEAMVAPANYKRPTALVTEKMVKSAQETIENLGFTASLKRRHATADDIPLTNLLFVNRERKNASVFEEMAAEAAVNPKSVKGKAVKLEDFIGKILPQATSVELLLENGHNFMSLIAPEDEDSETMFAWDNSISWTYQNNMADAIKEKVKKAGGKVEGELRMSLEWFNYDDLDLHVVEPGGHEISFRNKRSTRGDGFLDVDMNAGGGTTREPVENVAYDRQVPAGTYRVIVHNFCKRENTNLGFNVQIECMSQGTLINLNYPKAVHDREQVEVATFKYSSDKGIYDFKTSLEESYSQREVNGLNTNRFQKVKMMMFSPNYWTNNVGNKHLFFVLDKAKLDNPLRPFFNEYLKSSLVEHRKVFEILGSKLMVKPADEQLTGVGFSLTQQVEFVARVNGQVYRVSI